MAGINYNNNNQEDGQQQQQQDGYKENVVGLVTHEHP